MKNNHKSSQSHRFQRLSQLLRSIPVAEKNDQEWQVLENELFMRLAQQPHTSPSRTQWFDSPALNALFQPRMAWSLAGIPVLIVTLTLFLFRSAIPVALVPSGVITIDGSVNFQSSTTAPSVPLQQQAATIQIQQGQVFQTGPDGTITVRLDSATAFLLSADSRVQILAAHEQKTEIFLQRGRILLTVARRHPGQDFFVTTPNAQCHVRGTIFSVSVINDSENTYMTDLVVYEGVVSLQATSDAAPHRALIEAGQHISCIDAIMGLPDDVQQSSGAIRDISILTMALQCAQDTAQASGILELTSTPTNATVRIDNQLIGTTPMILRRNAGVHDIVMDAPNHPTWRSSSAIFANRQTRVHARLQGSQPAISDRSQPHSVEPAKRGSGLAKKHPDVLDTAYTDAENDPVYIEAMIQMTIGEYRKALTLLESMNERPWLSLPGRRQVLDKIAQCYRGIGDFRKTLERLQSDYAASDSAARAFMLWQLITLQTWCLQDYPKALASLQEYVRHYPQGAWIEPAFIMLADISAVSGSIQPAISWYAHYAARFPHGKMVMRAQYSQATLLMRNMRQYTRAALLFKQLSTMSPDPVLRERSTFYLAECYRLGGQIENARKTYQRYLSLYPDGSRITQANAHLSLRN